MQLYPILILAVVVAADGGMRLLDDGLDLSGPAVITLTCAPVVAAWLIVWASLAWCRRSLTRGRAPMRAIVAADRIVRWARWFLLAQHAIAVLLLGWLEWVRSLTGDVVLLDELIAISPPLLGWLALWWAHYPIERRLRDALLLRRMDSGQPIYPTPGRGAYVLLQARTNLLLLVPVLIIVGIGEGAQRLVDVLAPAGRPLEWIGDVVTVLAAAVVFLLAPVLVSWMLPVRPLGGGELGRALLEVCRRHGVTVRRVLVWETNGSMINAAVMGLLGRLRIVLITDALIETMPRAELVSVMAHEVGHVRRHHLSWLLVALLASFGVVSLVLTGLVTGVAHLAPGWFSALGADQLTVARGVLEVLGFIAALVVFGWVSRRFERQADTFAVQHLSGLGEDRAEAQGALIRDDAVSAMCGALETIARLNLVDPHRRSWRHGSIEWRRSYLRSLVGRPIHALPIDRDVRRIKRLAALALVVSLGVEAARAVAWRDAAPETHDRAAHVDRDHDAHEHAGRNGAAS